MTKWGATWDFIFKFATGKQVELHLFSKSKARNLDTYDLLVEHFVFNISILTKAIEIYPKFKLFPVQTSQNTLKRIMCETFC